MESVTEQQQRHGRRETVLHIPLRRIQRFNGQPRSYFNQAELRRLATSIAKHGQIQPGLVMRLANNKFELIDGERRFLACGIAQVPFFRAVAQDPVDARQQFLKSAITNYNREDHTPLEDARTCEHLHEVLEMTWEEVADALGRSTTWVVRRASLLSLDKRVQDMIEPKGEITVTVAEDIAKMPTEKQFPFACKVIAKHMGIAEVRAERRRFEDKTGFRPGLHRKRVASDDFRYLEGVLMRIVRDLKLQVESSTPEALRIIFANRRLEDLHRLIKTTVTIVVGAGKLLDREKDLLALLRNERR